MKTCKDCKNYKGNYCTELNNHAAPTDPKCEIFDPIKLVYLSGAITGKPNNNSEAFSKTENTIRTQSIRIINPLQLDHSECAVWSDYMREDIKALMDCDYIYMLKGYENSAGAKIELAIAQAIGIKVIYE